MCYGSIFCTSQWPPFAAPIRRNNPAVFNFFNCFSTARVEICKLFASSGMVILGVAFRWDRIASSVSLVLSLASFPELFPEPFPEPFPELFPELSPVFFPEPSPVLLGESASRSRSCGQFISSRVCPKPETLLDFLRHTNINLFTENNHANNPPCVIAPPVPPVPIAAWGLFIPLRLRPQPPSRGCAA
jgi:hypothetical protein